MYDKKNLNDKPVFLRVNSYTYFMCMGSAHTCRCPRGTGEDTLGPESKGSCDLPSVSAENGTPSSQRAASTLDHWPCLQPLKSTLNKNSFNSPL